MDAKETEQLQALSKKLSDITDQTAKLSKDLADATKELKALVLVPTPTQPPPPAPKPVLGTGVRTLEDIQAGFPEDLETRLGFEEKGDYIIIKTKQFLGSENFSKIASAIRGMGGEYISAGKDSHFRVPKKKP